jgi:acetyl esterase/lipase
VEEGDVSSLEKPAEDAVEAGRPRTTHHAGGSTGGRALAVALRLFVRPVLAAGSRLPGVRWPFALVDYAGLLLPALRGTLRKAVRLAHCRAEWVRAPGTGLDRAVLYLHGGGFVCCGLRTHRRLVSRLSAASGAAILSVDYRMLPKNPISTAVSDGIDGYRWLLARGFAPGEIVVAGDSAGGYLAFMVALATADLGLPRPAGVAALSPLTDLDPSAKLAHPNARRDPLFPAAVFDYITELETRAAARVVIDGETGPRLSPVDSELAGMPPSLIQVGSTEILLPDAELMAERLAEAGADCEVQVWDGQVHVFQAGADFVPEARRAIRELGGFVRSVTP